MLESRRQRNQRRQQRSFAKAAPGHRQLHERQRVALRECEQSLADRRRKAGCRLVDQCGCRHVVEGHDVELGQAGRGERRSGPVERGGKQRDRLGIDPPSHEGKHLARRRVQPVRVLGDDQDRRLGGAVADQIQRREADEEDIGHLVTDEAERGEHGLVLALR